MATALTGSSESQASAIVHANPSSANLPKSVWIGDDNWNYWDPKDVVHECPVCLNAPALKNFCGDDHGQHNLCESCFKQRLEEYKNDPCPECRNTIANSTVRKKIDEKIKEAFKDFIAICRGCHVMVNFHQRHLHKNCTAKKPDDQSTPERSINSVTPLPVPTEPLQQPIIPVPQRQTEMSEQDLIAMIGEEDYREALQIEENHMAQQQLGEANLIAQRQQIIDALGESEYHAALAEALA
ncbi:hypothetical protein SOPP22_02035 [Shewanella sp. OPT22]|nr:hypothetical protein SOPP22_02035 [Shewanella sp. OPT22]